MTSLCCRHKQRISNKNFLLIKLPSPRKSPFDEWIAPRRHCSSTPVFFPVPSSIPFRTLYETSFPLVKRQWLFTFCRSWTGNVCPFWISTFAVDIVSSFRQRSVVVSTSGNNGSSSSSSCRGRGKRSLSENGRVFSVDQSSSRIIPVSLACGNAIKRACFQFPLAQRNWLSPLISLIMLANSVSSVFLWLPSTTRENVGVKILLKGLVRS